MNLLRTLASCDETVRTNAHNVHTPPHIALVCFDTVPGRKESEVGWKTATHDGGSPPHSYVLSVRNSVIQSIPLCKRLNLAHTVRLRTNLCLECILSLSEQLHTGINGDEILIVLK
jgi:hypothetical protein